MKSAAARKAKGKSLDSAGSRRSLNLSVPSGLAKGSIYENSAQGGGFNTGALETSFNPLAIGSGNKPGEAGGMDISSLNVADAVGAVRTQTTKA